MKKAYFVKHPKTYKDLQDASEDSVMSAYDVVKTIELDALDYENFIYGMDADRQFIEDYAKLCSDGSVKKCLLIKQAKEKQGILVVPDPGKPGYIFMAAYIENKQE